METTCWLSIGMNLILKNILSQPAPRLISPSSSSMSMLLIFRPFTHRSNGRSLPTLPLDTSIQKDEKETSRSSIDPPSHRYRLNETGFISFLISTLERKSVQWWSSSPVLKLIRFVNLQKASFPSLAKNRRIRLSLHAITRRQKKKKRVGSSPYRSNRLVESVSAKRQARVVHLRHSFVFSPLWPTTIVSRACRSTNERASERKRERE